MLGVTANSMKNWLMLNSKLSIVVVAVSLTLMGHAKNLNNNFICLHLHMSLCWFGFSFFFFFIAVGAVAVVPCSTLAVGTDAVCLQCAGHLSHLTFRHQVVNMC